MTEPADLLDLHVAALFTQDEHGNLVATNDPEPDQVAAPRIYLGRSPERSVLRFRSGMDEATRAALRELAAPDLTANDPNREPVNRAAIEELLAAEQPIQNIYFGPAFSFPDSETLAASLNPGPFRHSREEPAPYSIRGGNPRPNQSRQSHGEDERKGALRPGLVPSPSMGESEGEGDQQSVPVPSPSMGEGEGEGDPGLGDGTSTRISNASDSGDPRPPETIQMTPSTTHLLSPEYAWLADELPVRNPVMAVVVDGSAVSVCFSARATRDAAEAGVETLPEHRGRRHAGAVTAAWAAEVRRQGRIPLYSTAWTNHPSRRVAARLGLVQYATDFHIS